MRTTVRVSLFFCLILVVTLTSAFAQSQAGLGSITGVVQDATGAVVPGAKVVVSNPSKGIARNLETNAEGYFLAPSLPPGPGYDVTVQAPGFVNYERRAMDLLVGQQVNLPVVLSIAGAQQTVEVSAGAPLVETTKQGVSQVVTTQQIDNLPINGRRVDSFVLLTPGVTNDGTFGLVSFRGIPGGNTFLTDGNDTTNSFYNENAGRTRISSQISQDAVQEFQVLSNGYSAEFGRAIGGVINTVTRSGTNDVHGTAYWFYRNQDFSALDRYATLNPKETRHQAGASVGGPMKKDKIFYFFNYEPTRRDFPAINRLINSSLTDTAGNFTAPCRVTSGAQPTDAQCAAAQAYIMRNNNVEVPRTVTSDLLFGKLDFHINDRNNVSASFNYLRWVSPNGIQTQAVLTNNNATSNNANSTVNTRYGRLSWTAIPSSTMVNEARFGWFKDRLQDYPNPAQFPPQTGTLYVTVAGAIVGAQRDYPRLNPSEQRFQFADTASWNWGKHQVKFGGDIMSTQDYLDILRNRYGSYAYSSFTNFALDFTPGTDCAAGRGKCYQSFTQAFGNPVLDFTTKDYDFFVQDQYRMTPNLTLNLGIRYEYTKIQQPTTFSTDYPQTSRIHAPKNNWAPRASLSYAFNDKTVVRAGYGVFYARYPGALLQTLYFTNGVYQPTIDVRPTTAGSVTFPNIVASNQGLPAGSASLAFASPDFRNPYTLQGDIAIERQLTQNLGLTLSYIYSHGLQFFTPRDLNIGTPGPDVTYRINDASGNQVGSYTTPTYRSANRVDSRYVRVVQVENGGQTWYNGLVVQLNKRFSHGLSGNIAYTWSHSIDMGNVGAGNDFLFFDTPRTVYNGNYRFDKNSSSLDQRHRLVINSLWAPTFTKNTNWVSKFLINGWTLSQITTLATPQFQTATVQILDTSALSGFAFTTSLNGFGGSTRVPFWPAQSVDIDNIHRVDARLGRDLPFTERFRLNLFFEAFNVFNTISNTAVQGTAYQLRGSVLSPFAALGAGTQSQGFPDGTNARRAQFGARFVF